MSHDRRGISRAPRARLAGAGLAFAAFIVYAVPCPGADTTVTLTVKVTSDDGKELNGSRVAVYQSHPTMAKWIVLPPDQQELTNAAGTASLAVPVAAGKPLQVHLEVSRDDYETKTMDVYIPQDVPSTVSREFVLKPKKKDVATGGADSTTTFNITVTRKDTEEPVAGANIQILSIGGFTPKSFETVSDANGKAIVVTPLNNSFEIRASKDNYAPYHGGAGGPDTPYLKERPLDIKLERQMTTHFVTVTVRDADTHRPVTDARVVLTGVTTFGFHVENTDSSGRAKIGVGEFGQFTVHITQDYYEAFDGEAHVAQGEENQEIGPFEMVPKPKKEEGKDEIEVTVLKNDPTAPKSAPEPLAGANVSVAGGSGAPTDNSGHATIKGSFESTVEVKVSAAGYKPKSKMVSLPKLMRYSGASASAQFILDPDQSVEAPFRLIVEVTGPSGKINGAGVDFFLPGTTVSLYGGETKEGQKDFRSSDAPSVPVADLRKGLIVKVHAEGYKSVEQSVPADLLLPSPDPRTFTVTLDRDWTALSEAIAALEAKVNAWRNDRQVSLPKDQEQAMIDKALVAVQRARELAKQLTGEGPQALGERVNELHKNCDKGTRLKKEIEDSEKEVKKIGQDIKRVLDEAERVVAACSAQADVDKINSGYESAKKLIREITRKNQKIVETRAELAPLVKELSGVKQILATMDDVMSQIDEQFKIADETANAANSIYNRPPDTLRALSARRTSLIAELNVLRTKYDVAHSDMPGALRSRLDALQNILAPTDVVSDEPMRVKMPESISKAPVQIDEIRTSLRQTVADARKKICDLGDAEEVVDAVTETILSPDYDITLFTDLPRKAEECSRKIADAQNEITVPDLSGLADLGAMVSAATRAGMVPVPIATQGQPGLKKLFLRQDPLAGTKSKKGAPLNIFVNQRVAENNTPTPTATAIAAASAKPNPDEVTVPDVSGQPDIPAMKAAAAAAGLAPVVAATKATPPGKSSRLFADQEPKAGSKAKRGSPLTISVYQSLAENSPSPSPTASASATAVAAGTMPDLRKLTLSQAVERLTGKMRIAGITQGAKPPTPRDELTVYGQTPAPGTKIDPSNDVPIRLSLYGSAEGGGNPVSEASAAPVQQGLPQFNGTYSGRYTGSAKTGFGPVKTGGPVRFTVSNGAITISSPGSGTGKLSPDGTASFGGGMDDGSQYTFSGSFNGSSGHGRWTAQFNGGNASGTWSASR